MDQVALSDLKNGLTQDINNTRRAQDFVDKYDKEKLELERSQYPRSVGPVPPEPYETFYCSPEISEQSDGYKKPVYSRVYDSPNVNPANRYEPLRSDLQAMALYEAKETANAIQHQQHLEQMRHDILQKAEQAHISHADLSKNKTQRRDTDKITKLVHEQMPTSTYASSYTPYASSTLQHCPPNQFYHDIEYTEKFASKSSESFQNLPVNLNQMQDKWSKTLANKRYHSAYSTAKDVDLRENIRAGKKIIREAPANAARFA